MRMYRAYPSRDIFVNTDIMKSSLAPLAGLFKALGDPTRLRILGLLETGEVCVCHLHGALGIPQPKASRHLAYLKRAGLVEARRDGLWMHYRLTPAADEALAAIRAAATRSARTAPELARDRGRLERLTGCCAADRADSPVPVGR
jgi:ArsR family transcriptional regulator